MHCSKQMHLQMSYNENFLRQYEQYFIKALRNCTCDLCRLSVLLRLHRWMPFIRFPKSARLLYCLKRVPHRCTREPKSGFTGYMCGTVGQSDNECQW